MKMFIDEHRDEYGVEPICRVLPIAPSTYRAHAARRADPLLMSKRARRDAKLRPEIRRVWRENFEVYGVRKVWRQLNREGVAVARCTVARLMAAMGLAGAVRGKPVRTTVSNAATPCPEDRVNREFHAPRPNALWLSDFTYVATWAGFVYVAFVIDAIPACRGEAPKVRPVMPDLRRNAAADGELPAGSSVGASPDRCRPGSYLMRSNKRCMTDAQSERTVSSIIATGDRNMCRLNTPSA